MAREVRKTEATLVMARSRIEETHEHCINWTQAMTWVVDTCISLAGSKDRNISNICLAKSSRWSSSAPCLQHPTSSILIEFSSSGSLLLIRPSP
jgi:hypothetical protein